MTMIKTYRRDDEGVLWYREIWRDAAFMVTHTGKVGTKGKVSSERLHSSDWPNKATEDQQLAAFREGAAADGYAEIDEDDMGWAVLQYWTASPDFSDPADARFLDEAEIALDTRLGWLGLGHCDGNDIGGTPPEASGREETVVNLFCPVVDTAIAARALRRFATEQELAPHCAVATRESAPDADYELAWTPKRSVLKTFTL
ncbi:hypothetical protein GCM10010922_06660 [Microbacterium sorbitolivorans]|uniref:WGR domain-containing protein n=1 Tax=Microbacterium sorbitolivorans TaxID=1867410 RepID=A0A367Y5Q4_9MICO|nr:hypothetical protein [Microbacterium sorbitolivorans]RCK61203.1 hypothetical protein DTO57_00685 [Microbacterium sorbitolivorans]GGF34136.1 hypothetical protein GCM10010922_06660 [Microbacterium sorbitolivorans]